MEEATPMEDTADEAAEPAAQRARCAESQPAAAAAPAQQQWPGMGTLYGQGLESRAEAQTSADLHVPGR